MLTCVCLVSRVSGAVKCGIGMNGDGVASCDGLRKAFNSFDGMAVAKKWI